MDDLPTKSLFEFISQEQSPNSDIELFNLLPDAKGEDYEKEKGKTPEVVKVSVIIDSVRLNFITLKNEAERNNKRVLH